MAQHIDGNASRRRRTALYLPASNARAIEKARGLDVDVVILDLEDAVAPDAKALAREQAVVAFTEGSFRAPERVLRVNALDTPWGADDLAAAGGAGVDAVLVPKVSSPAHLSDCATRLAPGIAIWAMIETPRAILDIGVIAAASADVPLAAFVIGTNDLAKDAHMVLDRDRTALVGALATVVLAARAYGLAVLDGVCNALDDPDALDRQCRQARALGFDGKTLIHPAQIVPCRAAFAPDAAAVAHARALVALFDAPENRDRGAVRLDGRMVERLHLAEAHRILADAAD